MRNAKIANMYMNKVAKGDCNKCGGMLLLILLGRSFPGSRHLASKPFREVQP